MAKLLFISNIAKRVGSFSVASIAAAKQIGFEYYYAANWSATPIEQRNEDENKFGIKLVNIDLNRSPYSSQNIKAYKQLVQFINDEKIDYIHCNTPVGGILGRLAGEKCHVKKVIYQAHGFHFYKGAPKKNWLIYYPIEKWLATKSDAIIPINREEYERAKKFKLKNNGKIYYVPGVGMDLSQYNIPDDVRKIKRNEIGLKETDIALISMGDLIDRKNYPVAIEAISKLNNANVHYFICGNGPEKHNLKKLTKKLNIENNVHFLGYRTDIKELLKASDIFLFTSKQEGLARSLMEAMACGLPCVVSKIRGNTDLIKGTSCGYLCTTIDEYVDALSVLSNGTNRELCSVACSNQIKNFDLNSVIKKLIVIYSNEF